MTDISKGRERGFFVQEKREGPENPRRPRGSQSGWEKRWDESFQVRGERAPGYRLSPSYFQKFKRMPVPDWAQKMLCIIVPNRRTVSPEFFS